MHCSLAAKTTALDRVRIRGPLERKKTHCIPRVSFPFLSHCCWVHYAGPSPLHPSFFLSSRRVNYSSSPVSHVPLPSWTPGGGCGCCCYYRQQEGAKDTKMEVPVCSLALTRSFIWSPFSSNFLIPISLALLSGRWSTRVVWGNTCETLQSDYPHLL